MEPIHTDSSNASSEEQGAWCWSDVFAILIMSIVIYPVVMLSILVVILLCTIGRDNVRDLLDDFEEAEMRERAVRSQLQWEMIFQSEC